MKPRMVSRLVNTLRISDDAHFGTRGLGVVILRDQAAHRYARERVEQRKHRLEHRAADILEIDVDAFRAGFLESRGQIGIAMIDAVVEAKFALDVVAFFLAAGDADGARALDLGDLPDRRADRPGGRGNHDGFARLRLADIEQARIGGHARHAEHANRGRNRRRASDRSCAGPCHPIARASANRHARARCRPWRSPDCWTPSLRTRCRLPSRRRSDRRRVGRPFAHAAAHIGIKRQPDRAQQHLPSPGVGIAQSSMRKSDGLGSPTGRETRTTRFGGWDMWFPPNSFVIACAVRECAPDAKSTSDPLLSHDDCFAALA